MTAATKKNKYECNGGTPGNIPRFRDFKRLTMGIAASADSRGQFHTGLALLVSRHLMDEAYLLIGLWYGIGPTDELGDIWTANLMEHGFVTKERSERRFRLWKELMRTLKETIGGNEYGEICRMLNAGRR